MKKFIDATPEGFDQFWSIWRPVMRNTDGKGLARDAYRKQLLRGTAPEDMIDGASWFIRNLTEKTRDYVPLSATWLNRETFDGLCDKEREYRARLETPSQANVVAMRATPILPATHFSRIYPQQKQKEQA